MKGLENRANRLSSEATAENILANNMQKKITVLDREIPSSLKVLAQEFTPWNEGGLTCVPPPCLGWGGHHGLYVERPDRGSQQG